MWNDAKYQRVVPRDFFNEALLLKCMGQLSLAILEGKLPEGVEAYLEGYTDAFEICLSESGYLYVGNYIVCINDVPVDFYTPYNSSKAYPLNYECPITGEVNFVFSETGELTDHFKEFCQQIKPTDDEA